MENEKTIGSNPSQVIQSLWIGGSLSTMEQLSAKSFLKQGHEYHLYTYGTVGGIPTGVIVKDANEILDKREIYRYKNGSYSAFSNLFRFTLLEKRGGYWADTDLVCVRSLKQLDSLPIVIPTEPSVKYDNEIIPTSCFIKLPRGSEIAKEGVRIQREHKKMIINGNLTWSSGPKTVQDLVGKYNLKDKLLNWRAVCSCSWKDAKSIVDPQRMRYHRSVVRSLDNIPDNMYCIHLWNEIWRRSGANKNGTYYPDSLYEQMKRTILI